MAQTNRAALFAFLFICSVAAQTIVQPSGKTVPQARTREELDAFGMVLDAASPQSTLKAAEQYRARFPNSEFLEYGCVAEMQAAMDLSKVELADELASIILKLNPNNPEALITRAEILIARPPGSGRTTWMNVAADNARTALDRLHILSVPPFTNSDVWVETKRSMLARAHRVLGQLFMTKRQYGDAVSEFEAAVTLAPSGKAFLLLSQAYGKTNQTNDALTAATKALSLGPSAVSDMAAREIAALKSPRF